LTDIFDYSEELEALKRVEIGMEEVLGIKHPNLSDCRPCHSFGEKDSGAGQAKAKELSCCVDYYFKY
jgi:nitrate/TMAO reductase-like tetraheme cytochrome c subunit